MSGTLRNRLNRFAAASALVAAFSMAAVPAAAADLPRPAGPASAQAWDASADTAHHGRRHRHHGGIDGGDILAGVLVLGGIAAIAGAVESNNRDRRPDYPPPPPPRDRYDYRGGAYEGGESGLDRAADICADAVEQTIDPVASVDGVRRGPSGWDVDGTLRNGNPFSCRIDNDGRIEDIRADRGYRGAAYDGDDYAPDYESDGYAPDDGLDDGYSDPGYDQSSEDNQWDDDTYARLRAERGTAGPGFGG